MIVIDYIKLILNKIKWKKKNLENSTSLMNNFDMDLVSVGNATYGGLIVLNDSKEYSLKIGDYCSIAKNVTFIVALDHPTNLISTYPFKAKITKTTAVEPFSKGNIVIDDDVWIGYNATILSGVHIGQGAVIAAGAVVTKDVPPYSIVGGVPANVIKYRFSEEIVNELLKIDYGKLSKEIIDAHISELYTELTDKTQLNWLPKK